MHPAFQLRPSYSTSLAMLSALVLPPLLASYHSVLTKSSSLPLGFLRFRLIMLFTLGLHKSPLLPIPVASTPSNTRFNSKSAYKALRNVTIECAREGHPAPALSGPSFEREACSIWTSRSIQHSLILPMDYLQTTKYHSAASTGRSRKMSIKPINI